MTQSPGAVPPDYVEILYWKLTENFAQLVAINLLAIPLAVVAGIGFIGWAWLVGEVEIWPLLQSPRLWGWGLLVVALTLGAHELAHGVAMQAFGATPRYGVKWEALALYATAPGYAFTRNQYLLVILMPLLSVSAIALVGMALGAGTLWVPALAVGAVVNATGACADVFMAWLVWRYPPSAYVIDEADGLRVFVLSENPKGLWQTYGLHDP